MKTIKNIVKKTLENSLASISFLESKYSKKEIELRWPPVFIIGAPRSGTTLLYQAMLNSFKFSYLPNISNYFYTCPVFAAKAGFKIFPKYVSSFKSKYGYEDGLMSPSEAGNIWNRWFPNEKTEGYNYTPAGYLNENSKSEIYKLVSWFQTIFDAPFVSKNLKMSVRLQSIFEIFPNALFVKCNRSMADSAYSILKTRRGKDRTWWSVMPKEIEAIKSKSEIDQVCNQVYFIDKNIREDINLFPLHNTINIDYKYFCENPSVVLDQLYSFFNNNKIPIKKGTKTAVSQIHYSSYESKSEKNYLQIKKSLEILYSGNSN